MKHKATLISVMTEKVFEEEVIEVLLQEGAKGYTIFEGGGNGPFHMHQSGHISVADEFRIVKIEVIVLDSEVADGIATRLMEECLTDRPGIVSLSEVDIFRAQKF
ncbi:hypothetical protein FLL45_03930 [Aliikangiella marina]|uniref:P-II family nitrogen regulator n=1 Tax=Aliikangiella marina TaxID=1712262 RepID=A0A545TIQ7_9GAMM|nr:hypothetical protein [Aliikangiella marina]TQV77109.1 hypothetical protein FLL45_03930 [Aliikangiella marina]